MASLKATLHFKGWRPEPIPTPPPRLPATRVLVAVSPSPNALRHRNVSSKKATGVGVGVRMIYWLWWWIPSKQSERCPCFVRRGVGVGRADGGEVRAAEGAGSRELWGGEAGEGQEDGRARCSQVHRKGEEGGALRILWGKNSNLYGWIGFLVCRSWWPSSSSRSSASFKLGIRGGGRSFEFSCRKAHPCSYFSGDCCGGSFTIGFWSRFRGFE